jgi:Flp pilus assembly protein TadG
MIEFMLFAILLFMPLSLGMVDVSHYFSALMACQSAAREAARGYSFASSTQLGNANAQAIAMRVLADSGIRYRDFKLRIVCTANPCLSPGASIRAIVDLQTDLRTISRAIHVEEAEPVDAWVTSK